MSEPCTCLHVTQVDAHSPPTSIKSDQKLPSVKPQKFPNVIGPLGLIHTCDFLGVNYCVNSFQSTQSQKWVYNPLLKFSDHTIVDQMAGVNGLIALMAH